MTKFKFPWRVTAIYTVQLEDGQRRMRVQVRNGSRYDLINKSVFNPPELGDDIRVWQLQGLVELVQ